MALPVAAMAVAGGSNVLGAGMQAYGNYNATQAAAKQARKTAEQNRGAAEQGFGRAQNILNPQLLVGQDAMGRLSQLVGDKGTYSNTGAYGGPTQFDPNSVNLAADPGVAYRLQQSQKALDTSAAGQGALFSGAQQKALQENAQNLASQEYANAFNRAQDTFSGNFQRGQSVFNAQQQQQNFQQQQKAQDLARLMGVSTEAAAQLVAANTNLTASQIAANNMEGAGKAAGAAAFGTTMANLGGTLSSAGLDIGKAMA